MRPADPARIAAAQAAGEAQRVRPVREWTASLPPASNRQQRAALLESLSPAMRAAAEAWERR